MSNTHPLNLHLQYMFKKIKHKYSDSLNRYELVLWLSMSLLKFTNLSVKPLFNTKLRKHTIYSHVWLIL